MSCVCASRDGNTPGVTDWQEQDEALVREFELPAFPAAIAFVDRLGELAESENHHPDIDIRYRRVTVRWTTHSEGGITEKDREMAEGTSALAAAYHGTATVERKTWAASDTNPDVSALAQAPALEE